MILFFFISGAIRGSRYLVENLLFLSVFSGERLRITLTYIMSSQVRHILFCSILLYVKLYTVQVFMCILQILRLYVCFSNILDTEPNISEERRAKVLLYDPSLTTFPTATYCQANSGPGVEEYHVLVKKGSLTFHAYFFVNILFRNEC